MTMATAGNDTSGANWTQHAERSNLAILRVMVWISLRLGRRIGRVVLYGIAAYFLVFAPSARRASRAYLARALGRPAKVADGFRHVLAFASTIHDRIYLLNERFDLFDIEIIGQDLIDAANASGQGVLLMGGHLGSFEVLRAQGRKHTNYAVSMLMYEENARMVNATLAAINPTATQDIIPLGRPDSMLRAREQLAAGHVIGMLADRGLGGDPTREFDFLGAPAPFPIGPFRVAAMLRVPVLFMTGLYLGGNRYRIHFEPLADFSAVDRRHRDAAIVAAQQQYVDRLAHFCRQAPYNWFNFFDFWRSAK
jgi:predicted LPLAT superfamily acyltransferase